MSLPVPPRSRVPAETARVARAAVPKGHPSLTLRDALDTSSPASLFAPVGPMRGQPADAPRPLAVGTILPCAEGVSDRHAAAAVRSRIAWQSLWGWTREAAGCAWSVLRAFRERLRAGGQAQLREALWERFRARGVRTARGKQRTDSPHGQAAVRTLHRVECGGATMRQALPRLARMAPHGRPAHVPSVGSDRDSPRVEAARLPTTERERESLALHIGQDGGPWLPWGSAPATPVALRQHPAMAILRQVWGQQYSIQENALAWRTPDPMPPTAQRLHAP